MKNKHHETENHEYHSNIIDPMFRELIAEILRRKPKDPLDFMHDWFKAEKRGEHSKRELQKPEKFHHFLDGLDA